MNCIYCGKEIIEKSKEHIMQSALGAYLKSEKILCKECNNFFSNKNSEYIDSTFVDQFKIFRNFFNIWGDRNTPPPVLRNIGEIDGQTFHLGPGGTPIFAKSIRDSYVSDSGRFIINVTSPNVEKALEQYEHIKSQYGQNNISVTRSVIQRDHYIEKIPFELSFGGEIGLKSVLKNIYSFLFYLQRDLNIDLKLEIDDFTDLRNYLRYNIKSKNVYSSIDYINQVPYTIHSNDLSNFVFIFGSKKLQIVFGYVVVLGHFNFSGVILENYKGEDFAYGIKQTPNTKNKEILDKVNIPDFNKEITKNYPMYYKIHMEVLEVKMKQILDLYFKQSSDNIIHDMISSVLTESLPNEGEIILPEHMNALKNKLSEEFTNWYFKIPTEIPIDIDGL